MFGIGPLELVVILVVALLVFGPKRVPELARTIGKGLAEFRRASNDLRQTLALDELQRDLQRDLDGSQTIHRPKEAPAQAVDEALPNEPSADKKTDEAPSETTSERDPDRPESDDDSELSDHHDEGVASEVNSNRDTHSNSPADSALGNVPVSGSSSDSKRG